MARRLRLTFDPEGPEFNEYRTQFLQLGFYFLYTCVMRHFRGVIHCAGINNDFHGKKSTPGDHPALFNGDAVDVEQA